MAQNKNALIRYKTIDYCLQNSNKQWTLDDFITACSDALYEYEGRDVNVSKRTVQLDIQLMRSDKLGYNAPIEVYDKKFYRYTDPAFSITNIPITENDMSVLSEAVEMLKQFKDFSLFTALDGIIQRLEDKVYTEHSQRPAIIHLDKNEHLKGLEHLDTIYQAILKKICLRIKYQSFKARTASVLIFHPILLKEYNNRWFLVGNKEGADSLLNLALDRIVEIQIDLETVYNPPPFDGDSYYKNTIGVTVFSDSYVQTVRLHLDRSNAPYVLTKPLHHSQKVLSQDKEGGIIVEIQVNVNFELERLILGFGPSIEVLKPIRLRNNIERKLEKALGKYKATTP